LFFAGDMTISTFADNVLEVTWVDGTGKMHVSKKGDADFRAFNGGLGVFGVMTELLIQLTPTSNAELITVKQNDTNMMDNINALLKVCEPFDNTVCICLNVLFQCCLGTVPSSGWTLVCGRVQYGL
jgi:hypothetical protein